MTDFYDKDGHPIDLKTFGRLMSEQWYVRVALTYITSATDPEVSFKVSTVWLGIDHSFMRRMSDASTPILIFETMVFGGDEEQDQSMWRWGTEIEAQVGHVEIVNLVAIDVPDAVFTEGEELTIHERDA